MKHVAQIILMAALLAAGMVHAQNYPGTRPVRILVGYTPGGGVDTTARMMAQALGELWGGNVLVENRPGAAGNIATEATAKAPPTVTQWCCAISARMPSPRHVLPSG
jgi:tripartite-type tricarboxylate transporter receptor subunit TctC